MGTSQVPQAEVSVGGPVGLRHLERLRLGVVLQVLALPRRQIRLTPARPVLEYPRQPAGRQHLLLAV